MGAGKNALLPPYAKMRRKKKFYSNRRGERRRERRYPPKCCGSKWRWDGIDVGLDKKREVIYFVVGGGHCNWMEGRNRRAY